MKAIEVFHPWSATWLKLSDQNRARAVGYVGGGGGYVESGRSVRTVATTFHASSATITNLMRRWRETGEVKDRPRSGRPRTTTAVEDQQIHVLTLRTRSTPATELRVNIGVSNWQLLGKKTIAYMVAVSWCTRAHWPNYVKMKFDTTLTHC